MKSCSPCCVYIALPSSWQLTYMPQVWAVISFFLLQVFQDLQAKNVKFEAHTSVYIYLNEEWNDNFSIY